MWPRWTVCNPRRDETSRRTFGRPRACQPHALADEYFKNPSLYKATRTIISRAEGVNKLTAVRRHHCCDRRERRESRVKPKLEKA